MAHIFPSLVCCVLGALCACASAASTVIGMLLQKEGLARESGTLFKLGLLIFTVVKPGAQIIALFFAPVSLVAPLASVAILLNAVIVPWFRAEQLSHRDAWTGAILVIGCIGTVISGPHDSHLWSYPELCDLEANSRGLTFGLSSFMFVVAIRLSFARSHANCQHNLQDESGGSHRNMGVALAAFVPSAASALNAVIIKVLLSGLVSGPGLALLPLVGALAFTAFLQVWSTTIGVQLFDMLVFVPVQTAEQILVTVAYGAIFFREMPSSPAIFIICTLAIGFGVLMSQSRPSECEGYHAISDTPVEQKAGCKKIGDGPEEQEHDSRNFENGVKVFSV